MTIMIQHQADTVLFYGLQHIEPYRVSYLQKTVMEWQHLLPQGERMSLEAYADFIEAIGGLRPEVVAHYLRNVGADARRATGNQPRHAA